MECRARLGGEPGCMREPENVLDCAENNGHGSDWCECARPPGPPDAAPAPPPPPPPPDAAAPPTAPPADAEVPRAPDTGSGTEDRPQLPPLPDTGESPGQVDAATDPDPGADVSLGGPGPISGPHLAGADAAEPASEKTSYDAPGCTLAPGRAPGLLWAVALLPACLRRRGRRVPSVGQLRLP